MEIMRRNLLHDHELAAVYSFEMIVDILAATPEVSGSLLDGATVPQHLFDPRRFFRIRFSAPSSMLFLVRPDADFNLSFVMLLSKDATANSTVAMNSPYIPFKSIFLRMETNRMFLSQR